MFNLFVQGGFIRALGRYPQGRPYGCFSAIACLLGDLSPEIFIPDGLRPAATPKHSSLAASPCPQLLLCTTPVGVRLAIVMEVFRAPTSWSDATGATRAEKRKRLIADPCRLSYIKEFKVAYGAFRYPDI